MVKQWKGVEGALEEDCPSPGGCNFLRDRIALRRAMRSPVDDRHDINQNPIRFFML